MSRYFTVMLVPERGRGVHSFKIPKILFHASVFTIVVFIFVLSILIYDYWAILNKVYENRHLSIENQQLKEQIQLFNMKIHTLTEDIDRIKIFEKKLRIISGIEQTDMSRPITKDGADRGAAAQEGEVDLDSLKNPEAFQDNTDFVRLKELYEKKIATALGFQMGYAYTKELSGLTKRSFLLAERYAEFDYKFNVLSNYVQKLEVGVHKLDQFLLDKESFLRSTPTLLPTKGWVTSYYGPRISPISNRLKMHEGIDIGAESGTPIIAPADGVVAYSGRRLGFGNFVQLDHGYGVETIYAHAKNLSVNKGDIVTRGDVLADIGSTGYSTGPHVHYEVRVNGTPVDPLFFILD